MKEEWKEGQAYGRLVCIVLAITNREESCSL